LLTDLIGKTIVKVRNMKKLNLLECQSEFSFVT